MLPGHPAFTSSASHTRCAPAGLWFEFGAGLTNLMVVVFREQRPSALSGCPGGIKLCVAGGKGNKEKIDWM